jgi:hypothetical protein
VFQGLRESLPPGWQCGGQGFESPQLHRFMLLDPRLTPDFVASWLQSTGLMRHSRQPKTRSTAGHHYARVSPAGVDSGQGRCLLQGHRWEITTYFRDAEDTALVVTDPIAGD